MPMQQVPGRGRIIMVNFELRGTGVPPEMTKSSRPCVVIHADAVDSGRLVTVVPLSTQAPREMQPYHHEMDHRSYRGWPVAPGTRAHPTRWAKCDYVTTVALDRCDNPYIRTRRAGRKYIKVTAIQDDMNAVDACIRWALEL